MLNIKADAAVPTDMHNLVVLIASFIVFLWVCRLLLLFKDVQILSLGRQTGKIVVLSSIPQGLEYVRATASEFMSIFRDQLKNFTTQRVSRLEAHSYISPDSVQLEALANQLVVSFLITTEGPVHIDVLASVPVSAFYDQYVVNGMQEEEEKQAEGFSPLVDVDLDADSTDLTASCAYKETQRIDAPTPQRVSITLNPDFMYKKDSFHESSFLMVLRCTSPQCSEIVCVDSLLPLPLSQAAFVAHGIDAVVRHHVIACPDAILDVVDIYGVQEERRDCVICLATSKNTVLLPCRHSCVCHGCLVQIDKCPVCRSPFTDYLGYAKDV